MGGGASLEATETQLEEQLKILCGPQSVTQIDQTNFWFTLLNIPHTVVIKNTEHFSRVMKKFLQSFVQNNHSSLNFNSLILYTCHLMRTLPVSDPIAASRLTTAVFILRITSQHFIRAFSHEELQAQLDTIPGDFKERHKVIIGNKNPQGTEQNPDSFTNLSWELIDTIVKFLVEKDVNPSTQDAHEEVLKLLITLLSTQLLQPLEKQRNLFFDLIFEPPPGEVLHAPNLVKTLLQHYIVQSTKEVTPQSTWTSWTARIIFFPYTILKYYLTPVSTTNVITPLADCSVLLLLLLVNFSPPDPKIPNIFRTALNSFKDNVEGSDSDTLAHFHLSYSKLYDVLTKRLSEDGTQVLLYFLLNGNTSFLSYALSRVDLDTMVIPLLKILHDPMGEQPERIYVILITLIILTQDKIFCQAIQNIYATSVPWFTDKYISKISISGLITVVLTRAIRLNLAKAQDTYMNTNCLACLTNMSRYYENLDAFSADRIVKLYEIFSKKILRLRESLKRLKSGNDDGAVVVNLETGVNSNISTTESEIQAELETYENFLQIVLEIINSTLTHKLTSNPSLVYAVLYKQELFDSNSEFPKFTDLISNIQKILFYFRGLLVSSSRGSAQISNNKDNADIGGNTDENDNNINKMGTTKEWTPEEVMSVITKGMPFWKADGLKAFPDLHFKYEEKDPAEFFTPYIWKIGILGIPGLSNWALGELELFSGASLDSSTTTIDGTTVEKQIDSPQ